MEKDNKVLFIGNPSMNPKIWELYKQRITGTKPEEKLPETTVEVLQPSLEVLGLKVGEVSQAGFVLRNTGRVPLVINDIKSSCGCTVPDWDKSPVKPGEETQVRVEIKPEELGYFHKTIDVYCNIKDSKIQLTVTGNIL
jgi:hypothetical protein